MRTVVYKVIGTNNAEFDTTSYKEATGNGNKIKYTFLVETDNRTDKEKAAADEHADKVEKYFQKKRG